MLIPADSDIAYQEKQKNLIASNVKPKADVCFLLDTTESMRKHITLVKDVLSKLLDEVGSMLQERGFRARFAVIGYGDYAPNTKKTVINKLDFTEDITTLQDFLTNLQEIPGRDFCEDVLGGLTAVAKELDWDCATRLVIHIADWPGHGKHMAPPATALERIKELNLLIDSYPDEDPDGKQLYALIDDEFVGNDIDYYLYRLRDFTDTMFDFIKECYARAQNYVDLQKVKCRQFEFYSRTAAQEQQEDIKQHILKKLAESISASVKETRLWKNKCVIPTIQKIVLDEADRVLFDKEVAFPCKLSRLSFQRKTEGGDSIHFSTKIDEAIDSIISTGKILLSGSDIWRRTDIKANVKIAGFFDQGGERRVFLAQDATWGTKMLLKTFLDNKRQHAHKDIDNGEKKAVLQGMAVQYLASQLAREFNQKVGFGVRYVESYMVEIGLPRKKLKELGLLTKDESEQGNPNDVLQHVFSMEPFIPGEFRKYSGNDGSVNINAPPQSSCFSHYTYERSGRRLVVVDVQGAGHLLTDPAIHSLRALTFGDTDRGQEGINDFKMTHVCRICHMINQPSLTPFAPDRQIKLSSVPRWQNSSIPEAAVGVDFCDGYCCSGAIPIFTDTKRSGSIHFCDVCQEREKKHTYPKPCGHKLPNGATCPIVSNISRWFYKTFGLTEPSACPVHRGNQLYLQNQQWMIDHYLPYDVAQEQEDQFWEVVGMYIQSAPIGLNVSRIPKSINKSGTELLNEFKKFGRMTKWRYIEEKGRLFVTYKDSVSVEQAVKWLHPIGILEKPLLFGEVVKVKRVYKLGSDPQGSNQVGPANAVAQPGTNTAAQSGAIAASVPGPAPVPRDSRKVCMYYNTARGCIKNNCNFAHIDANNTRGKRAPLAKANHALQDVPSAATLPQPVAPSQGANVSIRQKKRVTEPSVGTKTGVQSLAGTAAPSSAVPNSAAPAIPMLAKTDEGLVPYDSNVHGNRFPKYVILNEQLVPILN